MGLDRSHVHAGHLRHESDIDTWMSLLIIDSNIEIHDYSACFVFNSMLYDSLLYVEVEVESGAMSHKWLRI